MEVCHLDKSDLQDADIKIQQYLNVQTLEEDIVTEDSNEIIRSELITTDMIAEEKQLEKQTIQDQKEMRQKVMEEEKKLMEEKCFKRLNLLLSRSCIYVKFMEEKLKKSEILEKKRLKRQENLEKSKSLHNENSSAILNGPSLRRGVKRKSPESPLKGKSRAPKAKKDAVTIVDMFKKKNMDKISFNSEIEKSSDQPTEASKEPMLNEHPSLFTGGEMYPYQIEGYEWLKALYENGVNGILADEMGLGKTIQCIALISYLVEMKVSGPFFICAPLSTLPNWYSEFRKFAPLIPVILYHGSKEDRESMRDKFKQKTPVNGVPCCPVVLTSYQIALFDSKKLSKLEWKILIIDEAHRIKNFECKLVSELKTYRSFHRLLLTGTPLQNNLAELWSLLNFILPEIFDDLQVFQSWFDVNALTQMSGTQEIIAREQEKQIVSTIHQILTPFLLRRTKADVKLELPLKKEIIVHAPLSKLQETYYSGAINRTLREFFNKSEEETVEIKKRISKRTSFFGCEEEENKVDEKTIVKPSSSREDSEVNIQLKNILMCLRKVCNHPYLISYPLGFDNQYRVDEEVISSCGKMRVLDILLSELKKRSHRVIIFSQFVSMLHILEDYCTYRDYKYVILHGSLSLDDRQDMLNSFKDNSDIFLFLISTRAGGLGLNITTADTVIFYDSDFNPQSDLQAQDRCHRIGQTKPVVVYRLIVPKTIDEGIIERASAKRKLEKVIIKKGRFSSLNCMHNANKNLTKEELIELLESVDINNLVKTDLIKEKIFSSEELEKLLDRSDLVNK